MGPLTPNPETSQTSAGGNDIREATTSDDDRNVESQSRDCSASADPNDEASPADKPHWRRKIRRWFRVAFRITPAVTGVATLAVIIAQSVIYKGQWQVMQAQLELQGQALAQAKTIQQTSDRAWIVVKGIVLTNPIKAGEHAETYIIFTNAGKTPANNVHYSMWNGIDATGTPFNKLTRPAIEGTGSRAVLAPSADMPQHTKTMRQVSEDAAIGVMNGLYRLYVYGVIEYDDLAGHHSTDFCFSGRSVNEFYACADGNEAR